MILRTQSANMSESKLWDAMPRAAPDKITQMACHMQLSSIATSKHVFHSETENSQPSSTSCPKGSEYLQIRLIPIVSIAVGKGKMSALRRSVMTFFVSMYTMTLRMKFSF